MSDALRIEPPAADEPSPILGDSRAMRRAAELAHRFAGSRIPVLLIGPTGSGKELLARHIHVWSGRRGLLMDINCGALPKDLIESELFGRRRGAFSGALEDREGLIEAAQHGSVLLDEICSMPFDAQSKLLRVLDTGCVRRLGDTQNRPVDFRLIAASQDRLADRVAAGTFRLDLLQRLAGIVIEVPSLAERREDIVPMARAFAAYSGKELAASAEEVLLSHDWPGNVRELRNVIERAVWLSPDGGVGAVAIREALSIGAGCGAAVRISGAHEEREALLEACEQAGWHAGRIAKRLGIGRTTLYRRLVEYGISLRQNKRTSRIRTGPV